MSTSDATYNELLLLRQQVKEHRHRYYVDDNPTISDTEFDVLMRRLKELEAEVGVVDTNSPIYQVGALIDDTAVKTIKHNTPMLSLDNAFSLDDLKKFDEACKTYIAEPIYYCELKIDGLSIYLVYVGGKLVSAATRGDGITGELVTANVNAILDLPQYIDTAHPYLDVCGEVYMEYAELERINSEHDAKGIKRLSNVRNAAAGTLRALDRTIVQTRALNLYAYSLRQRFNSLDTHQKTLTYLQQLGFPITPAKSCKTIDEVWEFIQEVGKQRNTLGFAIDGVVVKLDSLYGQDLMGNTSTEPRWAVAYKFPPEEYLTQIVAVTAGVGKTGEVSPVVIVREVDINGVKVTNASFYNWKQVEDEDIHIGDWVYLRRAGDVIPEVASIATNLNDHTNPNNIKVVRPTHCPCCGSPLSVSLNGISTRCVNRYGCRDRIIALISFYGGKTAMDIDGLGDAKVGMLLQHLKVQNYYQLYKLTVDDLLTANIEGMGQKSAQNLITAINNSRNPELWRLISGLSIPEVGVSTAKALAVYFKTIEAVMSAGYSELINVPDVGPVTATAINDFFNDLDNVNSVDLLLQEVIPQPISVKEGTLSGKRFVITGSFPEHSRDQLKKIIEDHGGVVTDSVSKNTDGLLAGSGAGSKLKKAEKLGVPVYSSLALLI